MNDNGWRIPSQLLTNHLDKLVNRFFKILPLKESGDETCNEYIRSLQLEMIGCSDLIESLNHDAMYLSLISTLQYFIDHNDCDLRTVRREVFKSISICKKLQTKYCEGVEPCLEIRGTYLSRG